MSFCFNIKTGIVSVFWSLLVFENDLRNFVVVVQFVLVFHFVLSGVLLFTTCSRNTRYENVCVDRFSFSSSPFCCVHLYALNDYGLCTWLCARILFEQKTQTLTQRIDTKHSKQALRHSFLNGLIQFEFNEQKKTSKRRCFVYNFFFQYWKFVS